jgi:hypothetical protein
VAGARPSHRIRREGVTASFRRPTDPGVVACGLASFVPVGEAARFREGVR